MRQTFLFLILFGLQTHLVTAATNIVWIIADDMSPDIAAYGTSGVKTPNLDRLAREGRRFTRAYSSAPVCSSSRSAFILGCYQTTTGLHPHDTENPQPLAAPYVPLPELLRNAGFFVTNETAQGSIRSGKTIKRAKTHYNFAHDPTVMYDGDDWRKRKSGQPFFAQYQITEPHRPFPVPESFDEVALNAISLPANYPDHPLVRRDWYAYLRSVEVVDQRVGAILGALESEGVIDDTLIVFFADHGRPMPWGKQWLTIEGLQVPLLMRGPAIKPNAIEERLVSLIDLAPAVLSTANVAIPNWMEGKNLLATTFPERSYVFAARDRCGDAQDRIRAVISQDYLLVRNHFPELSRMNWSSYKESSYPGMSLLRSLHAAGRLDPLQESWLALNRAPIEFYDLRKDPHGVRNLASDGGSEAPIGFLEKSLNSHFTPQHDQGTHGDPKTEPALAEIQKSKRLDYERTWHKRLTKPDPTDDERVAWWMREYELPLDAR